MSYLPVKCILCRPFLRVFVGVLDSLKKKVGSLCCYRYSVGTEKEFTMIPVKLLNYAGGIVCIWFLLQSHPTDNGKIMATRCFLHQIALYWSDNKVYFLEVFSWPLVFQMQSTYFPPHIYVHFYGTLLSNEIFFLKTFLKSVSLNV